MKKIGFIGIGVMGSSMAINLMKAGYEVSVYTRTKEKAEPVVAQGATWSESIKDCVRGADAVITMVGYPKDVEDVYLSDGAILDSVNEGTYVIDMTTTSPKVSTKVYEMAKSKGIKALDAPVSGGDIGAKNGTLSIMVGGLEEDYEACKTLLSAMGTSVIYEGGAGCGQHVKMSNQIAVASALAGVCEASFYAETMGADLDTMIRTISGGAAGSWQLSNLAPKIAVGDYEPGFFLKHLRKDLGITIEEAHEKGVSLPIIEKVYEMCTEIEEAGYGEKGSQALYEYYKK